MKRVIDTNVLIAGLIRDSVVRKILTFPEFDFYIPEDAILELEKYKLEIIEKAGYTNEEFEKIYSFLLESVKLISEREVRPYLARAEEIMKKIDIKDSSFIAAALAINAEGIWSFDGHFKEQKEIKIFDIEDLIKEMESYREEEEDENYDE